MKVFSLILIFLGTSFNAAQASMPYLRFWRGTALPTLDESTFDQELNSNFIPLTANLVSDGLRFYAPVLPRQTSAIIPSEVALLGYQSEGEYETFMNTQAGKSYGAAHWQLFTQSQSSSVVVGQFEAKIAFESAYILDANPIPPGSQIVFQIFSGLKNTTTSLNLKKLQSIYLNEQKGLDPNHLQNLIFLITDETVIEYSVLGLAGESALRAHDVQMQTIFTNLQSFGLPSGSANQAALAPGSGMEVLLQ